MTQATSGKFFTKQLAFMAGYGSPKRFTTDVNRYGLPIHPCGPESFRDNLYDLPCLVKSALLRRLREIGLPVSRIGPVLALIDPLNVNEAVGRFLSGEAKALWCAIDLGEQPQAALFASNGRDGLTNARSAIIFNLAEDLHSLARQH